MKRETFKMRTGYLFRVWLLTIVLGSFGLITGIYFPGGNLSTVSLLDFGFLVLFLCGASAVSSLPMLSLMWWIWAVVNGKAWSTFSIKLILGVSGCLFIVATLSLIGAILFSSSNYGGWPVAGFYAGALGFSIWFFDLREKALSETNTEME